MGRWWNRWHNYRVTRWGEFIYPVEFTLYDDWIWHRESATVIRLRANPYSNSGSWERVNSSEVRMKTSPWSDEGTNIAWVVDGSDIRLSTP